MLDTDRPTLRVRSDKGRKAEGAGFQNLPLLKPIRCASSVSNLLACDSLPPHTLRRHLQCAASSIEPSHPLQRKLVGARVAAAGVASAYLNIVGAGTVVILKRRHRNIPFEV